jgi:hypothetical protein
MSDNDTGGGVRENLRKPTERDKQNAKEWLENAQQLLERNEYHAVKRYCRQVIKALWRKQHERKNEAQEVCDNEVLKLTVTSDSGGTVVPTLTYDYACSCGTKAQLSRISGFGLPEGAPRNLLLGTREVFTDVCRTCEKTNRILTEISVVQERI